MTKVLFKFIPQVYDIMQLSASTTANEKTPLVGRIFAYLGKEFSPRFGDQFFTFELSSIFVRGSMYCCQYCEYVIIVKQGSRTWTLYKRYSDFSKLNDMIIQFNASAVTSTSSFPGKTWFPSVDIVFINIRKFRLQDYLENLAGEMSSKGLLNADSPLCKFLELK